MLLKYKDFKEVLNRASKNIIPIGIAYLFTFVVCLIYSVSNISIFPLFSGMASGLLMLMCSIGLINLNVKLVNSKDDRIKIEDYFEIFNPKRVIKSLGFSLIIAIYTLLIVFMTNVIEKSGTFLTSNMFGTYLISKMDISILSGIIGIYILAALLLLYIGYRYSLSIVIHCVKPELSIKECLELSYKYMEGKFLTYVLFVCTYLILPIFGIGFIYGLILLIFAFPFGILILLPIFGLISLAYCIYMLFIYEILETKQMLLFIPKEFYEENCNCETNIDTKETQSTLISEECGCIQEEVKEEVKEEDIEATEITE